MDKRILAEYIDACELVRETEKDIKRLERKKKTIVQDKVKGSMPEFPYAETSFHLGGTLLYKTADNNALLQEEKLLAERKQNAERKKHEVEAFMNAIPMRMQRIIRFKYFEGLSWEQTAQQMGRKATGDSVRMEFNNFLNKKEK